MCTVTGGLDALPPLLLKAIETALDAIEPTTGIALMALTMAPECFLLRSRADESHDITC